MHFLNKMTPDKLDNTFYFYKQTLEVGLLSKDKQIASFNSIMMYSRYPTELSSRAN